MLSETFSPTHCDVGVHTECSPVTMVNSSTQCERLTTSNAQCQFPRDFCEAVFADHTYCRNTTQADIEEMEELPEEEEMDDDVSQVSQLDLFPDLNDDDPNEQENVAEEPMVILSQETLSSQSEYEPSEDGLAFQDEASGCVDQTVKSSFGKQRVFLIYEQKLQELLRFCPKCFLPSLARSVLHLP